MRFASLPNVRFCYAVRETQDGVPEIWLESHNTLERWYTIQSTLRCWWHTVHVF